MPAYETGALTNFANSAGYPINMIYGNSSSLSSLLSGKFIAIKVAIKIIATIKKIILKISNLLNIRVFGEI